MKGIYCLLIGLKKKSSIRIGSLGPLVFEKGNYVYVGSALNGLEGRIARHLRKEKRKHWHIDYLLSHRNARIGWFSLRKQQKGGSVRSQERSPLLGNRSLSSAAGTADARAICSGSGKGRS